MWLEYLETLLLRKLIFPFPRKYQLQIDSFLGVELCVHFAFSVLDFCLFRTCAGRVCAIAISVSS